MSLKVSIVIPGYNCSKTIQETIQACLEQNYPKELMEIIFVDDGSVDNTRELVNKFPVRYFYQSNSGPAKARNRGWREAKGEIIFFTDSDCIPEKNWINAIIRNFNSRDIGGVGGSYGIKNDRSSLARCIHSEILFRHRRMPREVKALGSYNLAIPKRILEEINGFNEAYKTSSGEDNDLCYRLLKRGFKLIFEPQAIVYHYYPEKLFSYLKHQFWHGFWRVKLYHDYPHMVRGDNYSGILDYLPPFLVNFFPLFIFFMLIESIRIIIMLCYNKNSPPQLFWLVPLRDLWRGVGLFLGLIKFFMIKEE